MKKKNLCDIPIVLNPRACNLIVYGLVVEPGLRRLELVLEPQRHLTPTLWYTYGAQTSIIIIFFFCIKFRNTKFPKCVSLSYNADKHDVLLRHLVNSDMSSVRYCTPVH